ncbi:TAXI family TRAP transporter solute-binding subunit [Candidatus Competibacter phosphatis]|uniref:TAXI family TRAP transporter solute-binding subunit n=1 Tax=Candidatus Competibacter phosphatis TaxID=221280 RepID=A0ABX1TKV4_9GAMM|nr:TAXI family TRAP transporter solute-binding subunit [Candidatus Competibacter phosphatis]NMQ20037.1 TAXI family TRAP transporter solute-binding subunit [Candidatus Competibacter phosphatis]
MKTSRLVSIIVIASMALGIGVARPIQAEEIAIGTASRAGVYFQVGQAICRLLNAETAQHGVVCKALPTDGSIDNLRQIRAAKRQLGIVQSDWQYHAVNGTGTFEAAGPDTDLRALFSVHGESFTVVARRDAGIESFDDLKGKRVNIGNPGSGQRATLEVLMAAKGWDKNVFSLANELSASEQSLALCHDRVQAMVYVVGHPNASVAQAVNLCDAFIVPVTGPVVDRLLADNPYYARTQVPGGIYKGNPKPVSTFGVKATVVASTRLSPDTAYLLVKTVFENLDDFKKQHPAFANLETADMIKDGLSAPLHDGALRYYREKGWL